VSYISIDTIATMSQPIDDRHLVTDKCVTDCRLDMESEKITKFFSFERRTTSIASRRAYNSALKIVD